MAEMAILIDVSRCTACRACQVACKEWNRLPGEATSFTGSYQNPPDLSATTWTLVQFRETADGDGLHWRFRKAQCMHCTDAICYAACPNDAITKYPEGNVVINQERCQGCLRCVESCPFQVPHLNPTTKKTAKCRGCVDRVMNGLPPACVKTCTSGALQYGGRARLLREAKARRDKLFPRGVIYGEREMGGLHVLYLLPGPPALYGLPEGLAGAGALGAALERVTRFALSGRG